MKNFRKLVGQKIAARRIERGINQSVLAERLKVNSSRVSDWERGIHLPEGKLKMKLLKELAADESLLDIDPPGETKSKAKKPRMASDLTVEALEALVSRASKRDNTINLENARLKKRIESIPEDVFLLYPELEEGRKALLLYVLTLDPRFVDFLSDETVKLISSVLRAAAHEKGSPR